MKIQNLYVTVPFALLIFWFVAHLNDDPAQYQVRGAFEFRWEAQLPNR